MIEREKPVVGGAELALYRAIVALMPEGVAVIRASDAEIVWANDRLAALLGHPPGGALGLRVPALVGTDSGPPEILTALAGTGSWSGTLALPGANETSVGCSCSISTFEHPAYGSVWLTMVDAQHEEGVAAGTAHRGAVLPGRGTFQDDLTRELARARRSGEAVSVAMLSLDGELDIADSQAIDLLADATAAWRGTLRESDSIAYYDFGDFDYVVLLPDCPASEAEMVSERTRRSTPGPRTCSAGFAIWDREESGLELAVRAHRALRVAQERGGDRSVGAQ